MSLFPSSACSEPCTWLYNPRLSVRRRRRRMAAGLGVESSVDPCGNDVGDVLEVQLEEPVGNPGTTIGT